MVMVMSSFVLSRSAVTVAYFSYYILENVGAHISRRGTLLRLRPRHNHSLVSNRRSSCCVREIRSTCRQVTRPKTKQQTNFSTSVPCSFWPSDNLGSSKTRRNSASIAFSSADTTQEVPSRQNSLLRERYIYVKTSANRWEDVPGGVLFDTGYLDSAPGEDINPSIPLVVSLHTTPGSFYDLQPILEACVKSGCRVLAPAFPGHGYTEGVTKGNNDVFLHTTSEKAEFTRDFLVNLGVQRVDLLLGHGSGCYPALRLAGGPDTHSMFKSSAFLSPWPHRDFRARNQKNLLPLLRDIWESPFYRPIARALSKFVSNTKNVASQQRITFVQTMYHIDFGEVGGLMVAMDAQKMPHVMLFAEDDALVEAELQHEMADMMGIGPDHTHHFTGQLHPDVMEQFPSCLVFDKGGHHLQNSHSGVITAVLLNLLKKVRPGFSSF